MKKKLFLSALALAAATMLPAQTHTLQVNAKKIGAPIQSTMYGMFFEDINYAADGGLYGELIKNRSFEFPQTLMGWQAFGNYAIKDDGPFEKCPHYITLSNPGHIHRRTGLVNEGYFGIGVKQGERYKFSVWAKAPKGNSSIRVQLIDPASMGENQQFTENKIDITSSEWKKYTVVISSRKTFEKAQLRIYLASDNEVSLEHISLFPVNTFKNRENGCRADIAQALADAHPGVFRFPGGCIVEGIDLATRYQWKNTVGPVENRPLNQNRWEYTFDHRYFPDYYQSYGLGFFEFFQLSEDIGAEPLPVVSCGLACQFQNGDAGAKEASKGYDAKAHVAVADLEPYIQDALDLIEFANGSTDTKWGKLRADMGHPEPFNLKMLGVGNEQWDYEDNAAYTERLDAFMKVLRKQHPEIKIVGTTGPDSEGWKFDILKPKMKQMKVDLVDEHFYRPESWFLDNTNTLRYENYDRKGPKIFAGEYACHGKGKKWNHYEASILEAGFMTDFERNADVVHMTAYAPLLAHVEGWQWRPDLIWYDNLKTVKTCSYYVQQLYALNKGTNMLTLTMDNKPVANLPGQDGLEASAVYDKEDGSVIVKIANVSQEAQKVSVQLNGAKSASSAEVYSLYSKDMDGENSIKTPNKIVPRKSTIAIETNGKTPVLNDELPAMSFKVYRIK